MRLRFGFRNKQPFLRPVKLILCNQSPPTLRFSVGLQLPEIVNIKCTLPPTDEKVKGGR